LLNCENLVELRGFEPLTPSMRTRCATGLRYSPKNASQRSKLRDLSAPGDPRAERAVAQSARTAPVGTGRAARTHDLVGPGLSSAGYWGQSPTARISASAYWS
jgi:hypothetical protein